jgi:16S rRNA processing protein RimM
MKPDELFLVGKIVKATGNDQEVVIRFNRITTERYKNLESVFIKINNDLIPFFIDNFKVKSHDLAIVGLLDSKDCLENGQLIGCEVYIADNQQNAIKKELPGYLRLLGYSVTDEAYGYLGTIANVLELPQQYVLQVDHSGREVLIPFVPEIVLKVDHRAKHIRIGAPEGLIEIYL